MTDPQTWNRYAYVANRPMNSVDPSGLACYPLERQLTGSCAGGLNDEGAQFGSNWNEFDLFNIPVIGSGFFWQRTDQLLYANPNAGVGDITSAYLTGIGRGYGAVGNGFALFGSEVFQQSATSISTVPMPSTTTKGPAKSPARQQCEADAQQKYSQDVENAQNGFVLGFKVGVLSSVIANGLAGCAVGAGIGGALGAAATWWLGGEGAILTTPAGCGAGGLASIAVGLPISAVNGLGTGGLVYYHDVRAAKQQLQQNLQACEQLGG